MRMTSVYIFTSMLLISILTSAGELSQSLLAQDLALPQVTDKKHFEINEQNFEYLVLDFWASWCDPCRESMPFYDEQSRLWKKNSVLFVGINVDSDSSEVLKFLKQRPIEYLTLLDQDRALSKKLGVSSIPRMFIFDKKLNLVKSFRGYTLEKKEEIKEELEKIFKQRRTK